MIFYFVFVLHTYDARNAEIASNSEHILYFLYQHTVIFINTTSIKKLLSQKMFPEPTLYEHNIHLDGLMFSQVDKRRWRPC